ncbi:hypothetical protein GPECTOR_44g45 [Gonium pectorale]|uniref:Uncharacterized protein n=1 Tax=Gonium pectorale TaxID=33097 RepID=A0A150G970_GONPE|nr:hypothetical protein GPECTOR_44g45 [Gonium pectorale]|eukprot:KXZ46368.1 hypothetical protein GPECTOR_44g45 [Gonium pectorale]
MPPADRHWAPEDKWVNFLGHKLASPLGVAAGPLLSAAWVGLAASRGYDVLTYKTIRSHRHAGHGLPNILYLDVDSQLQASGPAAEVPLYARTAASTSGQHCGAADAAVGGAAPLLAITNSFGMPSAGPEALVGPGGDLAAAQAALVRRPGQMLVVSVTGTPGRPGLTFLQDLTQAARLALDAGAGVLEVNLSCPNVGSSHVALYQDAPAVEALVAGLTQAVGPVPMLLKVGAFPGDGSGGGGGGSGEGADCLRRVLAGAAAAGAAGVAGINGLSRRVELPGGDGGGGGGGNGGVPALGPDRPSSGVCGDPIRAAGLEWVAQARQVIASGGLGLGLVGVGGVTQAEHAMMYLQAGADVVQAATGFMWKPHLGTDFQRLWAAAGYTAGVGSADGRGGRG